MDAVWINDLALDLEIKKFYVAIYNHELFRANNEEELAYLLESADHFVFIDDEQKNSALSKFEVSFFKESLSAQYPTMSFTSKEKNQENISQWIYYFGEAFSSSYKSSLENLFQRLEFCDV